MNSHEKGNEELPIETTQNDIENTMTTQDNDNESDDENTKELKLCK